MANVRSEKARPIAQHYPEVGGIGFSILNNTGGDTSLVDKGSRTLHTTYRPIACANSAYENDQGLKTLVTNVKQVHEQENYRHQACLSRLRKKGVVRRSYCL